MSGGQRVPAAEAAPIARRFVDLIKPYCDQLIVAGSLRRRLPTVADVEICVVPRIESVGVTVTDLFGETTTIEQRDTLHGFLDQCLEANVVQKRPRADGATFWGPRAKYLTYDGLPFDVFSAVNDWRKPDAVPTAEPDRFGIMLTIRTGPADYSHRLVTPRDQKCEVKKLGNGRPVMRPGLLPEIYRVADGWLTYRTSAERIPTPTEESVYELLGLDWVEPWQRH